MAATFEFNPTEVDWGSCPDTGQTVAQTITKWPDSRSMRVFTSGAGAHPTIPNIPTVCWSNKPALPTNKDDYVVPAFTLGGSVEQMVWVPWHEVDAKVQTGTITLADYHDLMDTILGQTIPAKVKVGIIVTAWGIATTGGNRPWANYWHDGVDEFGADFDGINVAGMSGSYFTTLDSYWLNTLDRLDEVRTAHPEVTISAPEWGVARLAADTTGTGRVTFIETWAERFRDFGMAHVEWFDNPTDIDSTIANPSNEYTALLAEMDAPSAVNLVTF